jgi:iron complex transport system permease protein
MKSRFFTLFAAAFLILVAAMVVSLTSGHYQISLCELWQLLRSFFGFECEDIGSDRLEEIKTVFYEIRVVRVFAAIFVGASLACAGAAFQGMFVNPLVSPGILGVLSGASFGFALALLLGAGIVFIYLNTFLFGFVAVFFALWLAKSYGRGNGVLMLVIGGIVSSALFGSLVSLAKYMADPYNSLPMLVYWLMGSLSFATKEGVLISVPIMFATMFVLIFLGRHIDILSLGEDDARALGVNVKKTRFCIIFIATLLSSLCVMLAGNIGWIGLVTPHIARFLVGVNHTKLIPFCMMLGGVFALLTDLLSRVIFSVEIPLTILTSIIGIPVFILVLRYNKKATLNA